MWYIGTTPADHLTTHSTTRISLNLTPTCYRKVAFRMREAGTTRQSDLSMNSMDDDDQWDLSRPQVNSQ